MPNMARPKVLNWASNIEDGTLDQAEESSKLPFIPGHIALMPDAHIGRGSTIGSVIPTKGAIIPAAIGVDIGCGMMAARLNMTSKDLPDNLNFLEPLFQVAAPGGIGKQSQTGDIHVKDAIGLSDGVEKWQLQNTAIKQCGTLGGGNHFIEICLDELDQVWVVLHSGSRGVGNQLAQRHIKIAQKLMEQYYITLPGDNKELAYLVDKTPEFHEYIQDMLWAQKYAMLNREVMMENILGVLFTEFFNDKYIVGVAEETINCHHNFTQRENHMGQNMWITRKGAIKADVGDMGIIPGSMGTSTFIVKGLGNKASYNSCAHGAGRKMSRKKARETFTEADLVKAMEGITWLDNDAKHLIDEIPGSYKDIHAVMHDQSDLVETVHVLNQILNYKGVN